MTDKPTVTIPLEEYIELRRKTEEICTLQQSWECWIKKCLIWKCI